MTSIDPNSRIAAAVRQQAVAARRPVQRPAAQARGPCGLPPAAAQRLAAIAPTDPERRGKAVRVFLESALLAALGPRLAHDPGFPALVAAVDAALREDAELAHAVEQLADLLLSA